LSPAELAAHPQVYRMIEQAVLEINSQLAQFEQIKKFTVMDHEFSEVTGELTPTLKIRRKIVDQMYKEVIDAMYPIEDTL
jgi:long-chain acyl-CoA synthetase